MPHVNSLMDALSRLQRRHPLALFLALGAALLLVDGRRHAATPLQAPKVAAEAQGAAAWFEEEVLYREALARGMDEGDLIVRRRLVQKMRLLLETAADVREPDAAALQAWIDAHPARYGELRRISLEHVFLSRSLRREQLAAEAAALAARLRAPAAALAPLPAGDPHPAGSAMADAGPRDLQRVFGAALAAQLAELALGEWQGPLRSALGLHFVRIHAREATPPQLAAVRERALRDHLLEQRRTQTELALADLKARYGLDPQAPVP